MRADLARELVAMAMADQEVRADLEGGGDLWITYHPRLVELHARHALRLAQIIDEVGWPGRRVVGEPGARAAWMVLQHAVADPDLARRCVTVLGGAMARGDVTPEELAVLVDRIRFFEGRPQVYGTQMDFDENGAFTCWPIEDPKGVAARRKAVGLPLLAAQMAKARAEIEVSRG
jgi:hypothetical protein